MRPEYYECPKCGFYHTKGVNVLCKEQLFTPEDLDTRHPTGWDEIRDKHTNLDRIRALTPMVDLNGNTIVIGRNVRVCTFIMYHPDTDTLEGIDGDRSYSEGMLMGVEDHEGVPCYTVNTEKATDIRDGQARVTMYSVVKHVRVNGSDSGLGFPMFAVFRVL
jgi:hypothetical protein